MIQVEGIFSRGGAPSLQSKSVTYTKNGTATITPDASYDALKKVDVTVNVASGGGGSAGFKVTFPATAMNWNMVRDAGIVQVDGTVIDIADYSTLAGKTITNVLEIFCVGNSYYFMWMAVQTGKIMLVYQSGGMGAMTSIAVDGETTNLYMNNGSRSRWVPLADTVISSIGLDGE